MRYYLLLAVLCASVPLCAQENTLATGGDGNGTGGTFSYSIGQIDYQNFSNTVQVTEGVQQPVEFFNVVSLGEIEGEIIEVFPNPMNQDLQISVEQPADKTLVMYDSKGLLVRYQKITEQTTLLPVEKLSSQNYYLEIWNDHDQVKTFKLTKH